MAYIYAVSDIHGHLDVLQETLQNVDLTAKDNKLILLGDYIDRGDKSCETLYFLKDLSKKYPEQVIVLRGNHEEMFLNDLNADFPLGEFLEIKQYISENEYNEILTKSAETYKAAVAKSAQKCKVEVTKCKDNSDTLIQSMLVYKYVTALIKEKHKDLLTWLKKLPYNYETENQIFVHAGIDEESGEDWKWGTSDEELVWKFPPTLGKFYKDIIAGHTHTSTIANDESYHKVFWDKESHFFIDGETVISKVIPLLKYDTKKKRYSSFEKLANENDKVSWSEYIIK